MQIVPMKEEHVSAVAALERACFSAPWDEASVRSELTNDLSLWLVSEDESGVAGYVGSQTVLGESDMMNLAVREDCRRQGIGRELVKALCSALEAAGSSCLTLEVRASNEPAQLLYEKLGFSQIGKRPNYYRNPKEESRQSPHDYESLAKRMATYCRPSFLRLELSVESH